MLRATNVHSSIDYQVVVSYPPLLSEIYLGFLLFV